MINVRSEEYILEEIFRVIGKRKIIPVRIDLDISREIGDHLLEFDPEIIEKNIHIDILKPILIQLIYGKDFNDYEIKSLSLNQNINPFSTLTLQKKMEEQWGELYIELVYKNYESLLEDEHDLMKNQIIRNFFKL